MSGNYFQNHPEKLLKLMALIDGTCYMKDKS